MNQNSLNTNPPPVTTDTAKAASNVATQIATQLAPTPNFKLKLKSRKFWLAVVGCISGICGMLCCSDNFTAILTFAALEFGSIIGYIIAEGRIDAAKVKQLFSVLSTLVDMIEGDRAGKHVTTDISDTDASVSIDDEKYNFTDISNNTSNTSLDDLINDYTHSDQNK